MSEPDLTPVEVAAADALRKALPEGRALILDWDFPEAARAVVGAIVPPIVAEYNRKRQESVIAATHAATHARGEVARLKHRLDTIERQLGAHMRPETDPCAKGDETWPCHVAAAIEPDTSLLEFLAKEDEL
jgi:hypothetical protein